MNLLESNKRFARMLWAPLSPTLKTRLEELTTRSSFSIAAGDLSLINRQWYVTHSGLLGFAARKRCHSIVTAPFRPLCDPKSRTWTFRATVYPRPRSGGFVGFGDADPSSVSPLVHGSEMRIAETRAVNRALRKAYGIGICSVEELGAPQPDQSRERAVRRLPPESIKSTNGNGSNGNGPRVRDRLCQIIRRYELDAELVKAYAVDFCGTKTLRDTTREQVESFVAHLADWAEKDRNALLCQLNSCARSQEGAA